MTTIERCDRRRFLLGEDLRFRNRIALSVDAALFEIASLAVRPVRPKIHDVPHLDAGVDLEDRFVASPDQPDDLDVEALDEMIGEIDHRTR